MSKKPQLQRHWTNQELKLAMDLWSKGATRQEIADALGRGMGSLSSQMERYRELFPRRVERTREGVVVEYIEFKLNVPTDLHAKAKELAKERGQTLSMFMRKAVEAYVKRISP